MKTCFLRRLPCRLSTHRARQHGSVATLACFRSGRHRNFLTTAGASASGNTYLPSLNRAADLFPVADVMAFCGDTGGSVWPVNMTIERERNRNTLSIRELDFQHQPCDFFAHCDGPAA